MTGDVHSGPCLYVANHISYIDPILIFKYAEANVVAKAEIASWPLMGAAATIIGTIFVKREEKSSRLVTAQAIQEALNQGISILIFPEGTTTDGKQVLPFRPRSFLAAWESNVPVQPVSISYTDPDVPFINDHTFLPHFFRLFRKRDIHAFVTFGPALFGENTSEEARQWIATQTGSVLVKKPTDELA